MFRNAETNAKDEPCNSSDCHIEVEFEMNERGILSIHIIYIDRIELEVSSILWDVEYFRKCFDGGNVRRRKPQKQCCRDRRENLIQLINSME